MDEPQPRSPAQTFFRNYCIAYLVFTIATGAALVPAFFDDRNGLGWLPAGLWVVSLIYIPVAISLRQWKSMSKRASMVWSVFFAVLATGYVVGVAVDLTPFLSGSLFTGNERHTAAGIKSLSAAEADFKANDRDENQVKDFWVGDVSMLYCMKAPGSGTALKLLELSMAAADTDPKRTPDGRRPIDEFAVPAPKAGYYYRAIRTYVDPAGKVTPYDEGNGRNRERFGFCAYSMGRAAGKRTFIVSEQHVVWWKDIQGVPVDTFPADPRKEGWTTQP